MSYGCTRVVLGYNTYLCAEVYTFQFNFDYRTTFLGINRTKVGRLGGEDRMQYCLCRKEKPRQKISEKAKNWSRLKPMKKLEKQKINHRSEPASVLCLSSSFALSSNDYFVTLVWEFFKGHQRTGRKKKKLKMRSMHTWELTRKDRSLKH